MKTNVIAAERLTLSKNKNLNNLEQIFFDLPKLKKLHLIHLTSRKYHCRKLNKGDKDTTKDDCNSHQ